MVYVEKAGKGVIVYLNQEGRGIGLMEKMRAYKLQEDGRANSYSTAHSLLPAATENRDTGPSAAPPSVWMP